jgi:Xaa-Pro aminopeptidase
MKSDIDALMESQGLDALLITGPGRHNPPMVYMTGGANLLNALLIKKRGQAPILFHQPMERDEAALTGLETRSLGQYDLDELIRQCQGDRTKALILRYQQLLTDLGLDRGRIGLYGLSDAGTALLLFNEVQEALPGLEFVGQLWDSLLLAAMGTKGPEEVERIRTMGKVTTTVVGQVADFLTSQRVKDEVLIQPDGSPLTISEVKRRINLWLAEREVENPDGTIFAIGRDSAVPHSAGTPSDLLRLGQTIIFDIFPCEAGGGYFYDFTRTWCLGYAPDPVLALYEDVSAVYHHIRSQMRLGVPCKDFQPMAWDLFEARGHPTQRSHPGTLEGYVHGLGHGVGLNVHESPSFNIFSPDSERLVPGVVITVEPGLYYPERGMAVRLEDTVWVRPDGVCETLADYPMDLVLPMKG